MAVSLFNKIAAKSYLYFYRFTQNQKPLNKLADSYNSELNLMGEVLEESLQSRLTPKEEKVRKKVESLRKDLIAENLQIPANNDESDSAKDSVRYLATVASKKENWGILLMKLISKFELKKGLEFGTCIGISAGYQAGIMQERGEGEFVSMEGLKARNELSAKNMQKLGLENVELHFGNFEEILPGILEKHQEFDYLFIDGDHRHEATVSNFEKVLPYMKEGSIVVVDDIMWSEGMKKAWQEIKKNNQVAHVFDLFGVGVCILGEKETQNEFKIALW